MNRSFISVRRGVEAIAHAFQLRKDEGGKALIPYLMAGDPGLDPGVARSMVSGPRRAGVAAVLTRLKTTLVAPVDPEAVARRVINGSPTDRQIERCRDALTAAGIPVTPEVGK